MDHENSFKVLVIDDNPDIHELMARTLQGTEFILLKANNGREGVVMAKETSPDVILLDIMMPDFDGFMTGKVLKRNVRTRHIPIIFLSAKKTREDINKAIQAGGSDYITKPFSPSNLLTHLRRTVQLSDISSRKTQHAQPDEHPKVAPHKKQPQAKPFINISMHDGVAVIHTELHTIMLENCRVYRDAFANLIQDGVFRIVLDTSSLEAFDGAGMALLISASESLKNYGGGLRLIYPAQDINRPYSFLSLSDLFHLNSDISSAIESFHRQEPNGTDDNIDNDFNVCLSCTFVNSPKARYCGFCGSNLVLGKGELVLEVLNNILAKRILSEAGSSDIANINSQRKFEKDGYKIPAEFLVEIVSGDINISYRSKQTDTRYLESHERIGIQPPVLEDMALPIKEGMAVGLVNPQVGEQSKVMTTIDTIDRENGMVYVTYNEDSLALHSMKNFSVAPKNPFTVTFTIPTLQFAGNLYRAKILELNRVRMVVFAEKALPQHRCLAINFSLPEDIRISSPIAVAQKAHQRYMYNVEFRLVDEKESTSITQYMYKRQIELAKGDGE